MADTEQLVLSISADVRQMQRALDRMTKDTAVTTRKIESHFDRMGKKVNKSLGAIGAFARGGLAGIGAGLSVDAFKNLLDANTRIINSLKVAGLEGENLTKVYDQLFAAAQKNGQPLESLVGLYSKLALSQKELGTSSQDLVRFANNIGVALRLSGTSAAQASGALLQLSQALGGGVVRAEEFNSILEGAPGIAQAAAAGIVQAGGSVAKLRQLMIDGQISSKAFFDGINAGTPVMEEKLKGAAVTIDQAFTQVANALLKATGGFDASTGASENFANFLVETVVPAVDQVANALIKLAGAFDGFLADWNAFQSSGALEGENWNLPDVGEMLKGTTLGNVIEGIGGSLGRSGIIKGGGGGRVGSGAYGMGQNNGLPYTFPPGGTPPVAPGAVDLTNPIYAPPSDKAVKGYETAAGGISKLKKVTDELIGSNDDLKTSTAEVTVAQDDLASVMSEVGNAASSAITGLVQDLVNGEDATESLKNALSQLADQLINIGLTAALSGLTGGLGAGVMHAGGTAGSAIDRRRVLPLAFAGAQRLHSGGMAGIRPGEVPAILQRGEMVLPKGARMQGSSVVVNNYSKAEVQAREAPGGKGFEIVIEERIADRINTRGTPANKAVRSASSNQLRKL